MTVSLSFVPTFLAVNSTSILMLQSDYWRGFDFQHCIT
jgi:hypothetical protein